ncbi:MAG: ABC transporter permease [Gemmataceae bacterium]
MRKVLVVALREYNAAVRTKAFVIGLVMMPVLMGSSIVIQSLFKEKGELKPRTLAVADCTPGQKLLGGLKEGLPGGDASKVTLHRVDAPPDGDLQGLRRELNARLRAKECTAWLLIGPDVGRLKAPEDPDRGKVVFKSSRMTDQALGDWVKAALAVQVAQLRAAEAGVSPATGLEISREVKVEKEFDASVFLPLGLMMLMFMLILMAATPLMQGVVEEKMQRIAEVLLGSVSPFRLMLGKLIGMTAVSLTISAVYLAGAYWAAYHYGLSESIGGGLMAWFFVFQTLAALMFGALFIAVGAACTDTRETQNLLWPVMLLATLPMFFLGPLMRSPDSPVIVGLSYFPFATPSMMIARLGMADGARWWEPVAGAALMLVTTLACVWVAGRIFRVGILLSGKGANLAQMARWVIRG